MKFQSTRDATASPHQHTFQQCLYSGYAPDGGMYLPDYNDIPHITAEQFHQLNQLSYTELVTQLMKLYIDDSEISKSDLQNIVEQSYTNFVRYEPNDTDKQVIDIVSLNQLQLNDHSNKQSNSHQYLQCELWHGTTLAFKDLALQIVGKLISHYNTTNQSHINILVGTSGDTGSAAIEAVRSLPYTSIYVLYPNSDRISRIQELQMITVGDGNVHVIGVDGSSDELDVPITILFNDNEFRSKYKLCSINSVNICRILAQICHIFYCYLQSVSPQYYGTHRINLIIPTGAAGHLVACMLCKEMKLPINKIVLAVNENNVLSEFVSTGTYKPHHTVTRTTSNAMDIVSPYNIERVLYMCAYHVHHNSQQAAQCVNEWLGQLNKNKQFTIDTPYLRVLQNEFGLVGYSADSPQVKQQISTSYKQHNTLVCTHTAVAIVAMNELSSQLSSDSDTVCSIVLATAHASKFDQAIIDSTGLTQDELNDIYSKSEYMNVRNVNRLHTMKTYERVFNQGEDWENKLRDIISNNNTN